MSDARLGPTDLYSRLWDFNAPVINEYLFLPLYRMSSACQKKCIPPKYHEGELSKGEAICLDRCVAKFLEVHDRIGKKLTSMYMQDEAMMRQVQR